MTVSIGDALPLGTTVDDVALVTYVGDSLVVVTRTSDSAQFTVRLADADAIQLMSNYVDASGDAHPIIYEALYNADPDLRYYTTWTPDDDWKTGRTRQFAGETDPVVGDAMAALLTPEQDPPTKVVNDTVDFRGTTYTVKYLEGTPASGHMDGIAIFNDGTVDATLNYDRVMAEVNTWPVIDAVVLMEAYLDNDPVTNTVPFLTSYMPPENANWLTGRSMLIAPIALPTAGDGADGVWVVPVAQPVSAQA